jgi:hypothetical protein
MSARDLSATAPRHLGAIFFRRVEELGDAGKAGSGQG